MNESKQSFKWYWLFEVEVVLAVAIGGIISFSLLFPDWRYGGFAAVLFLLIAENLAIAYGQKLRERIGPSRVRPPWAFRLFFWILTIAEGVGGVVIAMGIMNE